MRPNTPNKYYTEVQDMKLKMFIGIRYLLSFKNLKNIKHYKFIAIKIHFFFFRNIVLF